MPKIIYTDLEEDCISGHLLRNFCSKAQAGTKSLSFEIALTNAIKQVEIDLRIFSLDERKEFLVGVEAAIQMYGSQGERGMNMITGVQDIVSKTKTAIEGNLLCK
ncbi:hypothetical protein [Deinococcus ruber]|uniref:Uncharacterized protein n=1 Tax=Deinococcus ruber TaxID=1848197 RepID=A0A918F2E9_9DEIO|nr:hypothetical protein [Deinococcus ruber]GGR00956.1 hypothetical protein GCM10008957_12290 [Deinococcus ruber]